MDNILSEKVLPLFYHKIPSLTTSVSIIYKFLSKNSQKEKKTPPRFDRFFEGGGV